MQAPAASKPKYARALLRQLHIIDTKYADPILQEAYLANALVNPRGLSIPFMKWIYCLNIKMANSSVFVHIEARPCKKLMRCFGSMLFR